MGESGALVLDVVGEAVTDGVAIVDDRGLDERFWSLVTEVSSRRLEGPGSSFDWFLFVEMSLLKNVGSMEAMNVGGVEGMNGSTMLSSKEYEYEDGGWGDLPLTLVLFCLGIGRGVDGAEVIFDMDVPPAGRLCPGFLSRYSPSPVALLVLGVGVRFAPMVTLSCFWNGRIQWRRK